MSDQVPARYPKAQLTQVDQGILTTTFGALWVVHGINILLMGGALTTWGIDPRTLSGLVGILFAPLLHADLIHLLANTVFGIAPARFVLRRTQTEFLAVSVASALGSGALVWLFGSGLTIGFSGVLFGYLGYLFVLSRVGRRMGIQAPAPTVGSLVFALVYSLMPGISLVGHLGGFLSGAAMALFFLSLARARERSR